MRSCSHACTEAREPLAGSAGNPDLWVGLSWPKPLWEPEDALYSRGLPEGLAELVASAKSSGQKVSVRLFQRAPDPPTDRVELMALRPATGASFWSRDVPAAQVPTRIRAFMEEGTADDPFRDRPAQLLVCTDGRHDRCCAEHGAATYRALRREIAERRAPLEVAEASHLGGHRFASNCLVLPEGRLYGRLRPEDAGPLIDTLTAGRVYAERLRGQLALAEPRQAAEAFGFLRYPDAERIEVGEALGDPGEAPRVRLRIFALGRTHELELLCEDREFRSATSCAEDAVEAPRSRSVVVELAG